ncbi:hypothetical protein D3C79_1023680 [compost metagenome]
MTNAFRLEESIDFQGISGDIARHGHQHIEVDAMPLEQFQAVHHVIETGVSALVGAIEVVDESRAIETDPHHEAFTGEERAPVVIE